MDRFKIPLKEQVEDYKRIFSKIKKKFRSVYNKFMAACAQNLSHKIKNSRGPSEVAY